MRLVISKIEMLPNTKKVMECDMIYSKAFDDYENHPDQISFLGDLFVKTGWNSDRNIVSYKEI